MTTFNRHPWNFMPTEILAHIFSFLPVRDRHNVSCMCKLWASAVSSASVWTFTEVHCDSEENDEEIEEEGGHTSSTLLQKIQPYMGHIQFLRLVLDMSLVFSRRQACAIFDVMARKSLQLQGLQIVCHGESPFLYFGEDLLHSLGRLFQGMDQATLQHVDLRQMPFILYNTTISLVGSCSPNLRTLFINNHALAVLRWETIVEVLRTCPKLSTLGICYSALSLRAFEELLRLNREPFKYLELFYDGLDNNIPEDCWISLRERHPGYRVGLEFAASTTIREMNKVLCPSLPICQLHFHSFNPVANMMTLVLSFYAKTLEKLVLDSAPGVELNMALRRVAFSCAHLKEIHCFCVVSLGVVEAFRCHCPHLKRYTLSHRPFSPDNPPTIVL